MEYEQDDQTNEGGMMQRIKESPRTVSALIIILIVAAAIYAFSGEEDRAPEGLVGDERTDEIALIDEEQEETEDATPVTEDEEREETPVTTPDPVDRERIAAETDALPEVDRTDQGYVETATQGDGLTHLARRATTRFLNENTVDYEITNEHRIYIEDYIQKRLGSRPLALGEQQTISFDLIQEAVAAAGQLTPQQLNNLTQYTGVLR
jgi:hypothetical protein